VHEKKENWQVLDLFNNNMKNFKILLKKQKSIQ